MIPNWNPDGKRVVFWEADIDSTDPFIISNLRVDDRYLFAHDPPDGFDIRLVIEDLSR